MENQDYLHSNTALENNLANGWDFKFGDYLSRGFEHTNKQAGPFIGYTVLCAIIALVVGLIPIGGTLINSLFLTNCLMIGFALGAKYFQKTGISDFNSFWEGFKFIGPIAILGLIVIVATIVSFSLAGLIIGFSFIGDFIALQQNPGNQEIARTFVLNLSEHLPTLTILALLLGFLTFPLAFAPFFIAFYNKDAIKSIEASYKIISKNWALAYIFYLIATLIMAIGGAITCGLGLIYLFPAYRNMLFAMFEDMTGMNQENDTTPLANPGAFGE